MIDFHAHTYPPEIAKMVIRRLSGPSGVKAYTDATAKGLRESCIKNGINKCVVLPVVTNPNRTAQVNQTAVETNNQDNLLLSFGGIHPENQNYKEILASLVKEGIQGIKIHPIFQKTYIDDIRYMRIVEYACELGLIISIHSGLDINAPTAPHASVSHVKNLLKTVNPNKIILAHMGGHLCWNEAEDMLAEYLSCSSGVHSLYVDTAFCLPSPIASQNIAYDFLSNEQFIKMVRMLGSEHVLFGTDSPWTDHGPSIDAIKNSGLTEKEISQILHENAKDLLSL